MKSISLILNEIINLQNKSQDLYLLNQDVIGDIESGGDIDVYVADNIKVVTAVLKLNGWKKIFSVYDIKERYFFTKTISGVHVTIDLMTKLVIRVKKVNYYYQKDIITTTLNGLRIVKPEIYLEYYAAKAYLSEINSSIRAEKLKQLILTLSLQKSYLKKENQKVIVDNSFMKCPAKYSYVKRFLKPVYHRLEKKTYISFIGIDGVGKGTYINKLSTYLDDLGLDNSCVYFGHNEYELTSIIKIKQRNIGKNNSAYRLAYYFLFLIELSVRRYKSEHKKGLILLDRHPIFEPVSNGSFIYNVLDKLYKLISPTPDMIFFLSGSPSEIWARKKEHDINILTEMQNKLRTLTDSVNIPVFEVITTGRKIDDTAYDINSYFGLKVKDD